MRILGIDFGEARMGLALSDITEALAGGLETCPVRGLRSAVRVAAEAAKKHGAQRIVVGLPINMDGTQGDRAERVRVFAGMLEEETKIPVVFYDERRTTMLAAGYMNQTGTGGRKRKQTIDTLSAQIILQNYLDRQKNERE